jgi:predicted RNase H-like HicB family nuclease
MEYSALFEPQEDGYLITFPDFGWRVSQGDSEDHAREMAVPLLQTLVQEHLRKGEERPRPSRRVDGTIELCGCLRCNLQRLS